MRHGGAAVRLHRGAAAHLLGGANALHPSLAQSDPPLSHTQIEDSPVEALRVAIDAYGRAVGRTIDLVARGPLGR